MLVNQSEGLGPADEIVLRDSVLLAAPALGNLRNLAIAELRAATDALTGLPNNRAVRDTVKRMAAQAARTTEPLTAALLDLDHFKKINDTFGHGRGDDVLASVGAVLRESVRDSDFVGRMGGEEFVLLLPATGRENAPVALEKVRRAIRGIAVPGVDRQITASIGYALVPDHAGDADGVLRAADRALYVAKAQGRDQIVLANPSEARAPLPRPAQPNG